MHPCPFGLARKRLLGLLISGLVLPSLVACGDPQGLRATPLGNGPQVVIDWDAEPLPEIPFPNDLATRVDPSSPTGLRLNFSELAPTELEREARRKVNGLSGFGIFAPMSVRFDQPLDLDNLAARHSLSGDDLDDAIYVVDVTKGSPTYLQPALLDLGGGRFPGDLVDPGAYFPNDPRSEVPSLMFETHDEDANANGVLDPGEDTDNDGRLDNKPNVYPVGGDPREDLLTWYDRQDDTLLIRLALPLREETTYAVVVTERLVGEDGAPVRSPWPWVHHLRQTEALAPVAEFLPVYGMSLDHLAFAWSFTTGRITGDLVDLRRGLYGEGPFAQLGEDYPAAVEEAVLMRNDVEGNPYLLPTSRLVGIFSALDAVPEESEEALLEAFDYTDFVVGGSFTTPDLLFDRDDDGADRGDESWVLDATRGTFEAAPTRIAFTCVLPKPDSDVQPPFPVALYGHGYGSSQIEFFVFSWAAARLGFAGCAIDWPGHGLDINGEDLVLAQGLLEAAGMLPVLDHLAPGRAQDHNNDGLPDSGADQWIADGFHTRDMVRQAVLDWSQFIRALRGCGEGTMDGDVDLDGLDEVRCDWDGDGQHDLGGPDVRIVGMGGSLGGINSAIAAAVEPELQATVPVVAGGGLMDIGWRSDLGGVVEAVPGRLFSPLFLGRPQDDGTFQVTQMVVSATDMRERTVATLPAIPEGGSLRVENLTNGESSEGLLPKDGTFRLGIAADALDASGKRAATGMPSTGPAEGVVYEVAENSGLGDRLRLSLWSEDGTELAVIDTFESDIEFEGVTYRAGSPLVALAEGLGKIRGTPDLRRTVSVLSLVTEPGDPISYAPHYFLEPFEALGGATSNVLLMPTLGDTVVTVASEIALARAAGILDTSTVDPRYGMTQDAFLIANQVVRGLEEWGPFTGAGGEPALFDPDDLDNGTDGTGAPSADPLRATVEVDEGVCAMRIPYVSTRGDHGWRAPEPSRPFDVAHFASMQAAYYLATGGKYIVDDPCLEDGSCDFLRTLPNDEVEVGGLLPASSLSGGAR